MNRDEVLVWCVRLDSTATRNLLSPDELARAGRFRMERDRTRFIACRGSLRTILAEELGEQPEKIAFRYAPEGKPYVAGSPLRFNVSHSQDLALIAVAWGREVGVDIESVRPDVADSGIAERFFSAGERQALADLAPEVRARAFFACWTRKEAYLKARGSGLSLPLDGFEVTVNPDLPPKLVRAPEGESEASSWRIEDLKVPMSYAAALVAEGHDWEARCMEAHPIKSNS